jgi:hypothetical protein
MNDHENAIAIASILASQATLNDSVARALQSVALSADRIEADAESIRAEVHSLSLRVAQLEWNSRLDNHSRKVPS